MHADLQIRKYSKLWIDHEPPNRHTCLGGPFPLYVEALVALGHRGRSAPRE